MSRLFSSIIFTFFLLFQTTALAEEDTTPTETNIEEPEVQEDEVSEETEPEEQEEQIEEEAEPKEEISEAEKEAQAAEEAELRESGMGEEPLVN